MENGASTKAPMLTVPTVSSNMQTRTLSHKRLPCDTTGQKPNRLLFYLHIWKMKLGCSNSSQPSFLPAFQYIIISNFTHIHRHAQRWANINNLKRISIPKIRSFILQSIFVHARTHAHRHTTKWTEHNETGGKPLCKIWKGQRILYGWSAISPAWSCRIIRPPLHINKKGHRNHFTLGIALKNSTENTKTSKKHKFWRQLTGHRI